MSQLIRQSASSRLLSACAVLFAASVAAAPVARPDSLRQHRRRVKDAQGAHVPGATVTIVNKETNLTRDAVTDARAPTT